MCDIHAGKCDHLVVKRDVILDKIQKAAKFNFPCGAASCPVCVLSCFSHV